MSIRWPAQTRVIKAHFCRTLPSGERQPPYWQRDLLKWLTPEQHAILQSPDFTGDATLPVELPAREEYVGCVLSLSQQEHELGTEHTALVWDVEKVAPTSVVYATLERKGHAEPDATPEVRRQAALSAYRKQYKLLEERLIAHSLQVDVGRPVRVTKGRKLPYGTVGTVFWIGRRQAYKKYDPPRQKIGITNQSLHDGRHYDDAKWTYADNVEVIREQVPPPDPAMLTEETLRIVNKYYQTALTEADLASLPTS